MKWISSLFSFLRKWKDSEQARLQLDALLQQADPDASIAERNQWLIELVRWLHSESRLDVNDASSPNLRPLIRLRFLLQILERQPEWKQRFVQTLQSIFRDLDAIALLCDTGLPQNPGYWSELRERMTARLIPPTPNTRDWSSLLTLLFPRQGEGAWLAHIDPKTLQSVLNLFGTSGYLQRQSPQTNEANSQGALHLGQALPQSIYFLVTQIQAAGLSQVIRSRMDLKSFDDSPFLMLGRSADDALKVDENAQPEDATRIQELNLFRAKLDSCREAALRVFDHLDENGVSVEIVFQVERILARLQRVELLLDIWLHPDDPAVITRLLADLIRKHQNSLSILDLTRRSFAQLARKVVERSAETGEHYIARDRKDYRAMLHAALGGGVLTAGTVYLKFLITSLHLPKLAEGLFSSLNYAGSFLAIHFAGFTLATKQPAMTAPALASKLEQIGKPEGLEEFVQETVCLIRSQIAAIVGNLAAVTPIALAVQLAAIHFLGKGLITEEKAHATVASFSILGPTPLFAIFTGVLLWFSSLCAGWADNWFVYRKIADVITYHRRLNWVLGKQSTVKLAQFWQRHVSGIAANLSLGVMLALVPLILSIFLPFDLEVRHVTLSTGALAASVGVIGWHILETWAFWLAVGGIATMGLLNLLVSFALAFQLALRARNLPGVERSAIYRAVFLEIVRRPFRLFFPPPLAGTPKLD